MVDELGDEREAIVVRSETLGDRRLRHTELEARANRLAHHLQGCGVGAGDTVGCHLHNGTEYLEVMLAAFKLRAIPINLNHRYVPEELRYHFADAEPVTPDLVIVPLIAFTAAGGRLGQGGGHYDRWLAAHPRVVAVGIGWDTQLVESLPLEPHDRLLRAVVTPTRLYEGEG